MTRTPMRTFTRLSRVAIRMCTIGLSGLLLVWEPVSAQTPASNQPRTGGTLRVGIFAEPATLEPNFSNTTTISNVVGLALEGLARGAPDGSYLPVLATEIPTQANGDVSADGLTVTWKLRPDVMWSDGQPFTSQDVLFTYQVLMDSNNPVVSVYRADVTPMQSVSTPDENTVVVTYKQVYAAYREAFQWVLPAHVFGGRTSIGQDQFNRAPTVGTGPFVFNSWAAGDTIQFDRNPHYREVGKPYLDHVVFKITPSKDAAVQALQAGDLDIVPFLDESYLPQFQAGSNASIDPVPWGTVEKLFVNTSCSSGPQQGDPACSHPVLGDVQVRQAIAMAIDKHTMAHDLAYDQLTPATSIVPVGPYRVDLPAIPFDLDTARQLLDQDGWVPGSDGVRSRDGVRAHLMLTSAADDNFRAQEEQIIQQDLEAIGLDVEMRNVPVTILGGGFLARSPLSLGSFDLVILSSTYTMDPQSYLLGYFGSDGLPNQLTQTGSNFQRIADPELDQALATAGGTLDDHARTDAYATALRRINADAGEIPLYARLDLNAHSSTVQNFQTNGNDFLSWNAQDWWLN